MTTKNVGIFLIIAVTQERVQNLFHTVTVTTAKKGHVNGLTNVYTSFGS